MALETTFESERLRFRPVLMEDLEDIHTLHSSPAVNQYNTLGIPKDLEESQYVLHSFIKGFHKIPLRDFTFCLKDKAGIFIGLIALRRDNPKYKGGEIWYKIMVDQWGKGYATEAVRRVLDFAFGSLYLHRVEAQCAPENKASIRVLEKAGLKYEGTKRKVLPLAQGWTDSCLMAMLEEDYRELRKGEGRS